MTANVNGGECALYATGFDDEEQDSIRSNTAYYLSLMNTPSSNNTMNPSSIRRSGEDAKNTQLPRRLSWVDLPDGLPVDDEEVNKEDGTMPTKKATKKKNNKAHLNSVLQRKQRKGSRSSHNASSQDSLSLTSIPNSQGSSQLHRRKSHMSSTATNSADHDSNNKHQRLSLLSSTKNPLTCMTDDNIEDMILEKKKSRAIFCLRTLTLTTLTTAAIIVASVTYTYSRNAELQVFETQYKDSVIKVSEAIALDISNKLNTAMTFSAIYTSRYGSQNSWPNVTMEFFQEQAKGQLDIADGIALSFNPIITNETRAQWEAHAVEAVDILGEEKLQESVPNGIFRKVNNKVVRDPGYSPESRYPYHLVPVWQIYPTKQNWKAVMFNLHSEINRQRALDDMLQHEVPAITGLLHLVQHVEMDPSSILFYPVFNRFEESEFFRKVEGSISIVFTWADILRSVLPGYIKGLIVVLENSVTDELDKQQFTYSISGEEVTLLGEGDMHDSMFDMYKHEVYSNVAQGAADLDTVDYLITYKLRIYPSYLFQDQYLTYRPLGMTIAVVLVFIFTSAVFLIYDYLVHNRQNAIVEVAQRSGQIVNSMFPSGVRERLFSSNEHLGRQSIIDANSDGNERKNSYDNLQHAHRRNPVYQMKQFLKGKGNFSRTRSMTDENKTDVQEYIQSTPPIADLFQNTTIMFADIVSFTEWSSNHAPEDVFYLLETLFLEYDKVAERMSVFKLGTIGDCYIAVTGIPDPRDDHAVVMAQFADECKNKTNQVLKKLTQEFDPSVENLAIRMGLHSGPVTAGVLRGLKSRFELFGDTINTASRMESTGKSDMIQVSEETYTLLKAKGFMSWLKAREELVYAKGKGNLQTYWLEINGSSETQDHNLVTETQPSFAHDMYGEAEIDDTKETSRLYPKNENDDIEIEDISLGSSSSSSSVFIDEESPLQKS